MAKLKTRMHEFRKELHIQQAELAEMVGVRRETIGNLENGKYNPSLKLAMDIAKVFGNLQYSNIILPTPTFLFILIYYLIVISLFLNSFLESSVSFEIRLPVRNVTNGVI